MRALCIAVLDMQDAIDAIGDVEHAVVWTFVTTAANHDVDTTGER